MCSSDLGAVEAEIFDHAFQLMTLLATPILGLVLATLVYALLNFRASGPEQDGPHIQGTNWIPPLWVGISAALCLLVMIYPGLTGLAAVRADQTHELEVKVQGQRWSWTVEYPQGVKVNSPADDLVLPVNRRVKFDITAPAGDVLHSFWVPAFRQKLTALPGQTTVMYITPIQLGDGKDDAAFRVQCSELCGLNHTDMKMNVRVVSQADYDKWIAEKVKK